MLVSCKSSKHASTLKPTSPNLVAEPAAIAPVTEHVDLLNTADPVHVFMWIVGLVIFTCILAAIKFKAKNQCRCDKKSCDKVRRDVLNG